MSRQILCSSCKAKDGETPVEEARYEHHKRCVRCGELLPGEQEEIQSTELNY